MNNSDALARSNAFPIRNLVWLTLVWATLVGAVLIWQSYNYTGFFAWVAEQQFRLFDRLFPTATILLVVFILSLPLLILIALRLRRRHKKYGSPSAREVLARDISLRKVLGFIAIAAFVGAAILMLIGQSIGSLTDKPIANLSFQTGAAPTSGYIDTRALVLTDRISFYREALPLAGRTLYVVPVVENADSKAIKYFLEIPKQDAEPAQRRDISGFMKAQSVPGGLAQLYENAGYDISEPTYIIFEDHISARWPWFSAAGTATVAGLLLLLGVLVQTVSIRRQSKKLKEAVNSKL